MATMLDELLVGLGFEYDSKELEKFEEDLGKTTKAIGSLVKAALAGSAAITALVTASTAASDEQGKLAKEIGDTTENIDALQFAARRSGASAEDMTSSLRDLSIRAGEAARGVGSGIEAFGLLGIEVLDFNGRMKPTSALLLEVSKQFQGLSQAQQIELADKLGLRSSIRLLQQGPAAIRELTDEARLLGVTTEEDAVIAAEFQDSLTDIWQITKQLSRVLTRSLAPVLQASSEFMTDWWKANKEFIEQNLPGYIEKLSKVLKILTVIAAAWVAVNLVNHLISLISVLRTASLAAIGLNVAMAVLPLLIGLAVAAIALLAADAKGFFEGQDSFIGDMLEKYPEWSKHITNMAAVFATLADLTMMIFDGWAQIIKLFDGLTLDNYLDVWKNLPGFALSVVGLNDSTDIKNLPIQQNSNRTSSVSVDNMQITIPGSTDPKATADAVFNIFQQSSQDLNNAVDQ